MCFYVSDVYLAVMTSRHLCYVTCKVSSLRVLTYQNGNKRTLKLLRGRQVDEGSPILESNSQSYPRRVETLTNHKPYTFT